MVSAIRLQRDAEESRSAAVKEQVSRLEQEGCVVVALAKQVEARQAELEWQSRLEQENCVVELQQVEERLREVQERPDMTERIESIEKRMQVCLLTQLASHLGHKEVYYP